MKKRILIVADDKILLEALRQNVEQQSDLVTVVVGSCDGGIEIAPQLKPHLIVLDADLAGSDVALCQRLRKDRERSGIPLLVLFDAHARQGENFARKFGADDYDEVCSVRRIGQENKDLAPTPAKRRCKEPSVRRWSPIR